MYFPCKLSIAQLTAWLHLTGIADIISANIIAVYTILHVLMTAPLALMGEVVVLKFALLAGSLRLLRGILQRLFRSSLIISLLNMLLD